MSGRSWLDLERPSVGKVNRDAKTEQLKALNMPTEDIRDWRSFNWEVTERNRWKTSIEAALHTSAASRVIRRLELPDGYLSFLRDVFKYSCYELTVGDTERRGRLYVDIIASVVRFYASHHMLFEEYTQDAERVQHQLARLQVKMPLYVIPAAETSPVDVGGKGAERALGIMRALVGWAYASHYASDTGSGLAIWRDEGSSPLLAANFKVVMSGIVTFPKNLTNFEQYERREIVLVTSRKYFQSYNGQREIPIMPEAFLNSLSRGEIISVTLHFNGLAGSFYVQPVMVGNVIHMYATHASLLKISDVPDTQGKAKVLDVHYFDEDGVVNESVPGYTYGATVNTVDGHASVTFHGQGATSLNRYIAFARSWMLYKLSDVIATVVGLRYAALRTSSPTIAMSSTIFMVGGDYMFGHKFFQLNLSDMIDTALMLNREMALDMKIFLAQNMIALYFILCMYVRGVPPVECRAGVYRSNPSFMGKPGGAKNKVYMGSTYTTEANVISDVVARVSYNYAVILGDEFDQYVKTYASFCDTLIKEVGRL